MLDIVAAIQRLPLVGMLGWQDVRARYRRSALGPFWITLSMGVMIGTIGIVFGQIFQSPMQEFLPFLTIGMILWTFIASVITEGAIGFISAEGIIKQLPLPLFVHIMRMIWRNFLILLHNLVIFPVVLLIVGKPLDWAALLSVLGLLLAILNLGWMVLILAIVCARYRDLPQMVTSVLQVIFYLTPVMWMPSLLPARAGTFLLDLNPFYHMLEIARAPLLGQVPDTKNWVVAAAMAALGWGLALLIFGRYKRRIAYWL
ncbi:ABC transporter permease [Massilia haematophila]|uniref:ABC transporter permease n=1 Tax=Massilia haematophila TaxID=457923 RepID=A0ABV7PJT9_9BURK